MILTGPVTLLVVRSRQAGRSEEEDLVRRVLGDEPRGPVAPLAIPVRLRAAERGADTQVC